MELKYTWSELKAVQDRIAQLRKEAEVCLENRKKYWGLWDKIHELDERRAEMGKQVIPEVGMPCTVVYYSDRSAAVVTEVRGKTKKEVVVKQCGLYSGEREFTYRRNGHWVSKGTPSRDWGALLVLGYQSNHYDDEF